ncbi:MAG: hypothetical protein KY476_17265, partial [Planctomycetes bacterium]|nr:hypothetical protein [Planctomycetota bacterium]
MARRTRVLSGTATLAVVALTLATMHLARRTTPAHDETAAGVPDRRVSVAEHPVQLQVVLGLTDREQRVWDGDVSVSEGRVVSVELLRGANNSEVKGREFRVRAARPRRQQRNRQNLIPARLQVQLDAPPTATVTIKSSQGNIEFRLAELAVGATSTFLDGAASVQREAGSLKLSGPNTEDDHPAMAIGPDGRAWLVWVEYKPAGPVVMEQVANGRYESLVPKGHGDQIKLGWFDGENWQLGIDVTEPGRDVWRPTVAVGKQGQVVVAWAEKAPPEEAPAEGPTDGDWDIFYRSYTPPAEEGREGQWTKTVRVTDVAGADFNVVSTTDSTGNIWLAWQSFRGGHFDIRLAQVIGHEVFEPARALRNTPANEWNPSIAADSQGHVYVAWDTYERGNYDVRAVRFQTVGKNAETKTWEVAASPRFEARPHVICDAADRAWIAYEQGDVLWGKDYQGNTPERVGIGENPGYGLYVNRTVQVKCLDGGELMQPAADLEAALKGSLERNKSCPRLALDKAGGLWLTFRHHPLAGGRGETWHSYHVRFDGQKWSEPRELPNSSNILDNKPALVPWNGGVLAVHSSDRRQNTQGRDQDDLYATRLTDGAETSKPKLMDASEPAPEEPEPVHPNEAADIARLRDARVNAGGKELRFVRGEFHRHTEYTAHRDQDGLLEDSWRYALDAGDLDWMGNGDHDNGFGHEYLWWQIQKITDLYHNPPYFVAAMTYERSVRYPSGHRNVMFPKRGIRPLPRLGNQQPILYGTPEEGAPDIKLLYAYLKHFDSICAIHTSGTSMGTDWRDNDPEVEPVVEI